MGSFIGSQSDNEICDVLITRFSNKPKPNDPQGRTWIRQLRDHFGNENLFDAGHLLPRVFHRLAASVTGGPRVPSNSRSRRRWLHLLNGHLPGNTEAAIRSVLTAVLAPNSNIDYVIFSTRHVPTGSGSFELYPQSNGVPDVYVDANGKNYCKLVLECNTDAPLPDAPNEPDPPARQPGEKVFAAGRATRTRKVAKKSGKKSKKSSARKKTGKKSKAKARR